MKKSDRLRIPDWVLYRIAERDRWTCHVCQIGYIPQDPWEVDHDIPRARGGTNHVKNLRLAHRRCNRDKAAA